MCLSDESQGERLATGSLNLYDNSISNLNCNSGVIAIPP